MKYEIEEDRANQIFTNILENENFLFGNYRLWSVDLDIWLKDWVIIYNFNFPKIAEKFQDTIGFPLKYDYTEDEIRKHWAFIHAARSLGKEIDSRYYDELKIKYKSEFDKKQKHLEEEKLKALEEEEKDDFEFFGKSDKRQGNEKKEQNEATIEVEKDKGKIEEDKEGQNITSSVGNSVSQPVEEEVNTTMTNANNTITNTEEMTNLASNNDLHITNVSNNLTNTTIDPLVPSNIDFTEDDETISKLFKTKGQKIETANLLKEVESIQQKLNNEDRDNDADIFPIHKQDDSRKDKTIPFTNMEHDLMTTNNLEDYVLTDDSLKKEYEKLTRFQDFTMKSINFLMPRFDPKKDEPEATGEEELEVDNSNIKIKEFMKTVNFY
jgi:hypothetical protein